MDDSSQIRAVLQEETIRDLTDNPHSLLSAIVDSSDDAIISKNLDGIVTSWNPAANRIFGYSAEEMIGRPILKLIPDELKHEEDMILSRIRSGDRIDHYETTRIRKDGREIEVSVTISPIRSASGQIIGASKIARDVTERKRMERLLIQSEKIAATGRMAATVAHEINNPLEAVMNLIYLARRNSAPGGKALGYLQTAERELARVSHIARQTLGYYKETGSPVPLLLHDLINDVIAVYESKLQSNRIAVQCAFGDTRKITGSKGELLQVFSNIVANAIDAMNHDGILAIDVEETEQLGESGVQITVRDNGSGISQEFKNRLFEPFFTTKGNLGTGIGLWVSKQIVEQHSGRISITSDAEGGVPGTSVYIFLPFQRLPPPG